MKFNSTRGKPKSIYIRTSEDSEKIDKMPKTKIIFNQSIFQNKIVKIPVFSGLLEIVEEGMGG